MGFQAAPPSAGDNLDLGQHVGDLALIYARALREVTTVYGAKEAIVADVHFLTRSGQVVVKENAFIFAGALIGSLKQPGVLGGEPVLARIELGTAKPGQKPPYILGSFTAQDAQWAESYLASLAPSFQTATAQPPAQQQAPQQYPAPAQPAYSQQPAQQYPQAYPAPAAAPQGYAAPVPGQQPAPVYAAQPGPVPGTVQQEVTPEMAALMAQFQQ